MRQITLFLITISLLFGYTHNANATSLHSLNTYGAFLSSAAFRGFPATGAGVLLPNQENPGVAWNFTVPPDHIPGNPIFIGLTWNTDGSTPCTAVFLPSFLSVVRPGSTPIEGLQPSDGLTPLDGQETLVADAVDNISYLKLFAIQTPDAVTHLRPLDVVTFGLARSALRPEDTCEGRIGVQGVWIYIL